MPVNDLRDWIARIDALGQVRRVNGAECDEEIGAITDLYMERVGRPALLFDEIPGYPPGFRVLANVTTSPQRVAVTLDIPRDLSLADMVQHCRRFHGALPGIKPRVADSGPLQENVAMGADIDMLRFPTPKWHEDDGGRYLGTGCAVVMQDPDSDWINVGCYRVMVHDRNTLGIMITAGKQGRLIMEKYWRRNEACPVAVSFGHDPLIYLMAGLHAGTGVCEYDVAGGIRGEPVDVIRGEVTNLPLPATAEIAIEGHIPPGRFEPEGPFGEWTGYYAGGREKQPVIEVASLMYRNDPIILGTVPRKPPSDDTYISSFLSSSAIWEQMEAAGVPGIKGVWNHEGSGSQMFITVAIEQMYPGHSKQAAMAAAGSYAGSYLNKMVVVVDDDIDPTSIDDVVWAMCTRLDPDTDLDVVRNCWSSPLDPMAYPDDRRNFNKRMLIDACRPWNQRDTFPKVVEASAEVKERIRKRWPDLWDI